MQLQTLTLHNVGVYLGRQTIDLSPAVGRPVVLVGGLNGCGKTTLLDALQLCLYGNRARCAGRGALSYDTYLRELISHQAPAADGASIDLAFRVRIDSAEREYRVSRAWKQAGQGVREFVTVFVDGKVDPAISRTWADHVEDLLPLDLSSLFLFDGEKVKDLADPATATAVIRTAVNSLLGVGAIDQLRTDLTALRRRQRPPDEDPRLRERIDLLIGRLQQLDGERDAIIQRRAAAVTERRTAEAALAAAEQAFATTGGRLYEQRQELELQRQEHHDELQRTRTMLRSLAEGALPLALLVDANTRLAALAEQSATAERAETLLDAVAERDTWLLGLLPPGLSPAIADALAADRADLAHRSAYTGPPLPPGLTAALAAALDSAGEDLKKARGLLADQTAAQARLDATDRALAMVPSQDRVADALEQRESARVAVARLDGQLDVIDGDLQDLESTRQAAASELAAAEAERREHLAAGDYVRRVIDSIDRARDTLQELKDRQIASHVHKVEVAALEAFTRLMRKKGLIADLTIDHETFQMTLSGSDGNAIRPSQLSAGESQILAISLLWGLARVAGRAMPTVVDTPLGRLDSANRRLLVERYFPNASSQVLLLSTDEEIDDKLHPLLAPSIAREYLLHHDDATGTTTIREGSWWTGEGGPDAN